MGEANNVSIQSKERRDWTRHLKAVRCMLHLSIRGELLKPNVVSGGRLRCAALTASTAWSEMKA